MSDLIAIASILFKNLSDALLQTASELSKLNAPAPLSQAEDQPEIVSLEPGKRKPIQHYTYKPRERVIVRIAGSSIPMKYRILKRVSDDEYLVYPQGGFKAEARQVRTSAIMGLDPDR